MLCGAQRLPQLHIDVHRTRVGRNRLPVRGIDGGERHPSWHVCNGRRQVKGPARVATEDLHLWHHSMRQVSPPSSHTFAIAE